MLNNLSIPCPKCRYEAKWIARDGSFAPALDIYLRCPVITERLHQHPEERQKIGSDLRWCPILRDECLRVLRALKNTAKE